MSRNHRYLALHVLIVALAAVAVIGCSASSQGAGSLQSGAVEQVEGSSGERAGEHSEGAGHEEGSAPGEESGEALALTDVYDTVRNGARLRMVYDQETNSFKGIVQNTTSQTLCRVRVEVHLSTGTELGPTNPVDLPAGEALIGELSAAGETFERWSAHAETSPCIGGEGAGEHGPSGEHGEGGEHGKDSD
jgi:hypothetical protein